MNIRFKDVNEIGGLEKIFEIIQPKDLNLRIHKGRYVIDFAKVGCGPCELLIKSFGPIKEFTDSNNIGLLAVNFDKWLVHLRDDAPMNTYPFSITSTPNLVGYSDGQFKGIIDTGHTIYSGIRNPEVFIEKFTEWYGL